MGGICSSQVGEGRAYGFKSRGLEGGSGVFPIPGMPKHYCCHVLCLPQLLLLKQQQDSVHALPAAILRAVLWGCSSVEAWTPWGWGAILLSLLSWCPKLVLLSPTLVMVPDWSNCSREGC